MDYDIKAAAGKLGIGEDSLLNHINMFLRDFHVGLDKIRNTVELGNFDSIYFEFHRLKSAFRMISLVEAEMICKECCQYSHDSLPYEYGESLERIVLLTNDLYKTVNGEVQ